MQTLRTKQRGAAPINLIIALVVVGAAVYAGSQIVPLYYYHWNLQDDVKQFVDFAFVNMADKPEKQLNAKFIQLLDEIHATYEKKNVKVNVDESSKKIVVEIWYTRSVKVPFFPNPKQFYIRYENRPL